MSPYLYILCVEGVSIFLNEAKKSSLIKRMKVARGSPTIKHLFFTDDSIVFYRANLAKWWEIQCLLDVYEAASSHEINKLKTEIFLSFNMSNTVRRYILNLARVLVYNSQEKYLGLPIMVGANRYQTFQTVKDWAWTHISNWKNTFLSQLGKEVLLKVIVQVIPTYPISLFLSSQKICREIAPLWPDFGGATRIKMQEFIGKNGGYKGKPNHKVGWAFVTWTLSTKLF